MLRSKKLLKQKNHSHIRQENKSPIISISKKKCQRNYGKKLIRSTTKSNQKQIKNPYTPNKCHKNSYKNTKLLTCTASDNKRTLSPHIGRSLEKKIKQNLLTQQYNSIRGEFQQAIARLFHILDIFSTGIINEVSANKWVPEEALYFLGSVFQKIKINKLNLNLCQFMEQCFKIFEKSSQLDVKQFIYNISKHKTYHDNSKQFSQHKQTQQSQNEQRIYPMHKTGSSLNTHKLTNIPFPMAKTSQFKETKKNQNIQYENLCVANGKLKSQKLSLSPLTKMNQFQNVSISKCQNKKQVEIKNYPSFSKTIQKQKQCQHLFLKESNTNRLVSPIIAARRDKLSSDRLQKLSMKLGDYIKQNIARLQRSQKARYQL